MTAWLYPLESAINTYLSLDPASFSRFQKLAPAALTIELLPFALTFQLEITPDKIKLHPGTHLATNTKITGTPLQLLNAMLDKKNRQTFFSDDVTITGNAELCGDVIALFDKLDIDWEELLSQKIGDTPTYHLKRGLDTIRQFVKQTNDRFSQDISEYLHEEWRVCPPREALEDFYHDIDQLRMRTDRLEAKINALRRQREGR